MNFGQAFVYVLRSINKIPNVISGLSYYTSGGLNRSISLLSAQNTHIDMRNTAERAYIGWCAIFWGSFIIGLLTMIVTSIPYGLLGFLTAFLGGIAIMFGSVISLVFASLFVFFGENNKTHWNTTFMKILTVIYFISMIGCVWTAVTSVIGLIQNFAIISLLSCLLTLINQILYLCGYGMILDAINQGTPTNYVGGQSNSFGQQNQYNQQNSYGQQGQYNQQNQYGQQGQYNAGLGGLGAVNVTKTQPPVQSEQPSQNSQLYACPYCNNPVVYGANPCPHCNNILNWGS